jgi:hypothetical protein
MRVLPGRQTAQPEGRRFPEHAAEPVARGKATKQFSMLLTLFKPV